MNTILSRAADILEQPNAWTQGAYARDANGNTTMPADPDACRFCMMGAIRKAAAEQGVYPNTALRYLSEHEGITDIAYWNDNPTRNQGQVVAALRNAAK